MLKRFINKITGKNNDIPIEQIGSFAKEHFAARVTTNEEVEVPFQDYDFSVHFLEIKTGEKISSAKVVLTFVDTRKGIYVPLLLWIGEKPHPAQELEPLFGKQPNRLLAQEIGYSAIRFGNHYHFAGGYEEGNQLAEISDYETYQKFHSLLVKLCTDCELSSSKITDEMLVDLRNFVANNDKVLAREPLEKLLDNDHSDPWVYGRIFEKLEK